MKIESKILHPPRRAVCYNRGMEPIKDSPLPATMAFVFSVGGMILVGWILMYVLLRSRW